ncbi:MAG: hypothetical protein ABI992_03835 [Chthoniobacterales bacterium]
MKKHLFAAFVLALAAAGTARAQSFSAPVNTKPRDNVRHFAPVTARGEVGSFTRAARGGNPIQLLNPRAPSQYFGPPEETVTVQPYFNRERYTGQVVTGLIFFGLRW